MFFQCNNLPYAANLGLRTVSRHAEMCSDMPASLYSYQAHSAGDQQADSLQNTNFSDTSDGAILGSFELEHSLCPSDALLIVLGDSADSYGPSDHGCRRLTVCNQTADGRHRRLRLRVKLQPNRSYTMKIFKLANGSGLCEQPRVRFFFTRSAAGDRPLLQLAVRRCGSCDVGEKDGFRCDMAAYMQTGDWPRGLRLRVKEPSTNAEMTYNFSANRDKWTKQLIVVGISRTSGILLQTDIYSNNRLILWARKSFHAIRGEGTSPEKLLQLQLCQLPDTAFPNFTASCLTKSASSGYGIFGMLTIFIIILILLILIFLILLNHQLTKTRHLIIIVRPEENKSGFATRFCCGNLTSDHQSVIQKLRRELSTSSTGVYLLEIVGLHSLLRNLHLVANSRLVILLSWDAEFTSFNTERLTDQSKRILTTLLQTEKYKFRRFFIDSVTESESERTPVSAADSTAWISVAAKKLEDEDLSALNELARSLACL